MATPPTGRPRGRPRKGTTQKMMEGNPGKRKLPEPLAEPIEGEENAPPSPGLKDDALRMWIHIWDAAPWLNVTADYYAVLQACRNFEEFELLRKEKEIGIFGRTYRTPQGQILAHPKVAQLKDARIALDTSLSRIGLDPEGRARLEQATANEVDPMEQMNKLADESRTEMMKTIEAVVKRFENE